MSLFYSKFLMLSLAKTIVLLQINCLILINKDKNAITYLNSLCKICLKNIHVVCTSFYL